MRYSFEINKEFIVELNFWRLICMSLLFNKIFYNYVLLERLIYIGVSDCLGVGFCMEIFWKIVRKIWRKLDVEWSLMLR